MVLIGLIVAQGKSGNKHDSQQTQDTILRRAFLDVWRQDLNNIPSRVHEAPIRRQLGDRLMGHIARDSTAIEARELHIDTADGDIPVTAILTSASVHDSQAAIPPMRATGG